MLLFCCICFHPNLTLTLWYTLQLQHCQPLSNDVLRKKEKESVCFALKIDLQLVLFHSICRTLRPSSEMERCVSFVFMLDGWRVWMQFTRFLLSHRTIFCVICFFFFFPELCLSTLSSLSILLQHNGAGVVKLPQPGNQI